MEIVNLNIELTEEEYFILKNIDIEKVESFEDDVVGIDDESEVYKSLLNKGIIIEYEYDYGCSVGSYFSYLGKIIIRKLQLI
jgi:hypothetical protein